MLMSYLLTNGQVVPAKFKSNVSLAAVVFAIGGAAKELSWDG